MEIYRQTFKLVLFLSLLFVGFPSQAQGQNSGVTLVVAVTDPNGAAIAGASVTINQLECQCETCPPEVKNCKSACCDTRTDPATCCIVAASATSDDDGNATFEVNPGRYQAKVDVSGFKTQTEEIEVKRGQTNRLEVKLGSGINLDAVKVRSAPKQLLTSTDEKTLTVKITNQSDMRANIAVIVKTSGCACGECPAGKTCLSGCCDCKQGDCVCCIVAEGMIDSEGVRSFSLPPGSYDVSLKMDNKTWGTFLGVDLESGRKTIKLPLTILSARPQ